MTLPACSMGRADRGVDADSHRITLETCILRGALARWWGVESPSAVGSPLGAIAETRAVAAVAALT